MSRLVRQLDEVHLAGPSHTAELLVMADGPSAVAGLRAMGDADGVGDSGPPVGEVTMLFTDIEGSTRLARALGAQWPEVLAMHHAILGGAIREADGYIDGTEGDAFFAVFPTASAAVAASTQAQRGLRAASWPAETGELRVRMGVHTASVERFGEQYVGLEVHRAARVASAAHGGQVLLTGSTKAALDLDARCDDLGAHRLKDFPEPTRLHNLVVDGRGADTFPPPATLDALPTNLPPTDRQPEGRQRELDLVRTALLDQGGRLVTITGPGGAGKTTLALAAARSLLDDHEGGVWLVRAEALTDTAELLPAIGTTLWVRDTGSDLAAAVARRLSARRILLVLDNLEHLRGAAEVIANLLAESPTVAFLTTSRAPLGLVDERTVGLGPLPLDAARSVLRRAAAGGLTGAPRDAGAEEEAALDELCAQLDGLPLALELVAPRLRVESARRVLERLGPISELSTTAADRPGRHRSLRATVDWTVALLTPEAATLVRRLACFQGAAPLDLIEEVCAPDLDAVDALRALLDFSLVQHRLTGFALVTAAREVVLEQQVRSPDADLVYRRHASALAGRVDPDRQLTVSVDERRALRELEGDVWAATQWARGNDPDLHRRLVVGHGSTWALQGLHARLMTELDHALGVAPLEPLDRSRLLRVRSYAEAHAGDIEAAQRDGHAAVQLARGHPGTDLARALIVLSQAQNVARRLDESLRSAQEAADELRASGDAVLLGRGLTELAQACLAVGDVARARAALDEVTDLAETETEQPALLEMVTSLDADLAIADADFEGALRSSVQFLDDEYEYVAWCLATVAIAFAGLGAASVALELGAIAEGMARDQGADVRALVQVGDGVETALEQARAMLTPDEAAAAQRSGRRVPAGRRVARARQLVLDHLSSRNVEPGEDAALQSGS